MRHLHLSFVLFFLFLALHAGAQDYSNRGLMDIKDQSELLRMNWVKAFEDAIRSHNFAALPALRKENEQYLDKHLAVLGRMYAEGDGRALLTAVRNYMQIERQFVRDAMVSAEAIDGNSQEAIDRVYRKINEFGEKEKMFLVDINNAIATEGLNAGGDAGAPADEGISDDEEFEQPHGSVVEETSPRRRGRLPHERGGSDDDEKQARKKSRKKSRSALPDEEEE